MPRKRVTGAHVAQGNNVATVGGMIATAIQSIVSGLTTAESGLRAMISGALDIAIASKDAGIEPELVAVRVQKLFTVARDAIVASLSEEGRGAWDGYLPTANPQPKDGRKASGLPMKDRLNARDVRVLARRNGTMAAEVRAAHDAIEATYHFASKVGRVTDALLTVDGFGANVEKFLSPLQNGIDFEMSASMLLDAAKDALKVPADDAALASGDEDDATVADTLDAIIARTVAQLRAIGRDDAADAILATVATFATVEEVTAE